MERRLSQGALAERKRGHLKDGMFVIQTLSTNTHQDPLCVASQSTGQGSTHQVLLPLQRQREVQNMQRGLQPHLVQTR